MIPLSVIRKELEAAGLSLQPAEKGILLTGPGDVLAQLTAPAPAIPPLTMQQRKVLEAIRSLVASKQYAPSVREIGKAVGLASSSTVHQHLTALQEKGCIVWEPMTPHSIRIVA